MLRMPAMSITYKEAGVDIDAGNEFVSLIKERARRTCGEEVLAGIGGFGALFAPNTAQYKNPVLVSSTDGVGTKLALAIEHQNYTTLGQDLVAMCANDLACLGATPLFFLDYFATGKLRPAEHAVIINGISDACQSIGCALVGGETAEMPCIYKNNDFDMAGFVVGIVEREKILDGKKIRSGDSIIGVASSGFHSNGFSLIRRIITGSQLNLKQNRASPPSLIEQLLTPTHLYSPLVTKLLNQYTLHGIAHITGGGLTENIPRILPKTLSARIVMDSWQRPAIMTLIQEAGRVSEDEMRRVFNCGIGLTLVVPQEISENVLSTIHSLGFSAWSIGTIVESTQPFSKVIYT